MPELANEGVDAHAIARLVSRLARANEALDAVVQRAEASLVRHEGEQRTIEAKAFLTLPDEIRLRLLHRAVDRAGHEGPAELGKVETLLDGLMRAIAHARPFRRTLAGALVASARGKVVVEPAPPRRNRPRRS
jgi:tRNA(Ile)-lysidine synthase